MARSIEGKTAPILLGSGINQAGGTRGAAPGSLEYVINGRILTAGRIEPRCGTTAIAALSKGGGGSRAYADSSAIPRPTERPAFAAQVNGQKVKGTTAGDLYVYDGTFDQFRGCFSASRPVRRTAPIASASPIESLTGLMPAAAVTSTGYKLVATVKNLTELLWVILGPNGETIYRGEGVTIDSNTWPRAVVQGTKLILVYQVSTAVNALSHETSTGVVVATGPTSVLTLNSAAAVYWDVSSYNSSQWYVVGRTAAGTTTARIVDTVTGGATGTFATSGEPKLSIWGDATNAQIWIGYSDSTPTTGFTTKSADLTTVVYAPTQILASTTRAPLFGPRYSRSGANSDVFYVFRSGNPTNARYGYIVAGAVSPATPETAYHVWPVSKPDAQQRFWALVGFTQTDYGIEAPGQFVLLRYAEPPGSTSPTLTVDLSTPLDAGHGEFSPDESFQAVAVESESAGASAFFATPFVLGTFNTSGASGVEPQILVNLYEYRRYNQEPTLAFTYAGDELIFAGQPTTTVGIGGNSGNLSYYGGVGAVELGFAVTPLIQSVTNAGAAGIKSFVHQTIHQWVDAKGQRHVSAASPPVTTTAAAENFTVVAHDLQIGQRKVGDSQQIATLVYRTVDGGEIPQFTGYADYPGGTGTITFSESTADGELATNEFLPTAGGVLPVRLAPACRYIRAAEDRLWCAGLWDRNIIEASRIKVPAEPYSFTQDASHQVVLPGDCNGIAYQDGQIVAFCDDGIYLVGGDGPNDQGAGTFLPPRAYVRGLGCTEAESASILETELGIIFRSPSSWWLIPRGFGAPIDIGGQIQSESTHCLAAAITETANYRLARFLVADAGEYSSDTILTFDLMNQQWFRDVYAGAAFGTIGAWPDGLALLQYSLDRTGAGAVANVVWSEDEDNLTDAAASPVYIPLSLRTNWQYPFPFGPSGWGKLNRVQLAAEPLDAGGAVVRADSITITVETDQNSYAPTAWANTANADSGPIYREVTVSKPQCTCYRVTVQVVQSSGTATEGLRLLSIATELEPDGGIRMLPDAERSG